MPKFHGEVGYVITKESTPGVWTPEPKTKIYTGDVEKNSKSSSSGEHLNDNITINNVISIVADAFAYENFMYIKYVKWMGVLWEVTKVDVQRPRLKLTLGGVYNG